MITAGTYTAKYRDGSGIVREMATGCRDESAARSILGKLERRAELVKGEVLDRRRRCHNRPPGHAACRSYRRLSVDHSKPKGLRPMHRANVRRSCIGWPPIAGLSGSAIWLANLLERGL